MRKQYLKIKQEHGIYKKLKEKLGLSSSNFINIKKMKKNLQQSNLGRRNDRE